jgi:hypothetical protein
MPSRPNALLPCPRRNRVPNAHSASQPSAYQNALAGRPSRRAALLASQGARRRCAQTTKLIVGSMRAAPHAQASGRCCSDLAQGLSFFRTLDVLAHPLKERCTSARFLIAANGSWFPAALCCASLQLKGRPGNLMISAIDYLYPVFLPAGLSQALRGPCYPLRALRRSPSETTLF